MRRCSSRRSGSIRSKVLLLIFFFLISIVHAQAREGLFLKLSLGPGTGVATGLSGIKGSGYSLATKNHAIGWAFNNKFAISINEFGSLVKKDVGGYYYINLDAPYAVGFTYFTPWNFNLFVSGGPSKVYYAHKWTDPNGDIQGKGYGINTSIEKEWMVSKRVGVGTGAQAYFIQTKKSDLKFLNFSVNFIATFYWNPVR